MLAFHAPKGSSPTLHRTPSALFTMWMGLLCQ
jgi:hypothetical protein